MANNQQNNNRLKYGAAFLGLLIIANLAVRLTRSSPSPTPVQPARNQNVTIDTSNQSLPPMQNNALPQGENVSQIPPATDVSLNNIDLQIKSLQDSLDKFQNQLQTIPIPVDPPDLSVSLFLARKDLFKSSVTLVATGTGAVSSATLPLPASQPVRIELLGSFEINGTKKLLVRKNQKVYLVVENAMDPEAEISLLSSFQNTYTILDKDGTEKVLKLKRPRDENVEKIVKMLKQIPEQPSYNIYENASSTLEP